MKKVFVISQGYPSEERRYLQSFLHARSKEYKRQGIDVSVISFSTKNSYEFDNIKVYNEKEGVEALKKNGPSIILLHAPNLKNHVRFYLKYKKYFYWTFLFFHGHEVLKEKDIYPKPYFFNKKQRRKNKLANFYDALKIPIITKFLKKIISSGRYDLVFVSKWMLDETNKSTLINLKESNRVHIINNSLNEFIKEGAYKLSDKKADFITIRPLDTAKYSIDLVVDLAKANPDRTFHIYGKGKYFDYNEKPSNITVLNEFIHPKDMPTLFNQYNCALMPTKADAQGLMMCEMATYGMPIITSDLPVCHEMLDEYDNVMFIDNERFNHKLSKLPSQHKNLISKFDYSKTVQREIDLIKAIK